MALSNLKNITRTYLSSSTPKRLLLFTISTGHPSQPLRTPFDSRRFTLFGNSRSPNSIRLSLIAQNPLIPFRISNARRLCCEPCEVTNDVEKIYRSIMEISSCPSSNLEEALDSLVGVEVTTELVLEILHRLRFEEKLAFRFFTWAGRWDGYAHEARVYSEMINTLSNTVHKAKRFRLVCETLDYMKRNGTRTVPAEALLEILKQYCKKYLRTVWKIARRKAARVTTQPPTSALNLLLESLCDCGLAEDAERTMMRMGQMARPNLRTYTVLFYGWCRVRRPADAVRVLSGMTNKGFEPDNLMYTAAIETLCVPGMVDAALKVFESMRSRGGAESSPTAKTYSLIIAALIRNDRIEEAERYLGLMMADGCVPDVPTYKVIIEGMCLAGKIDMAYRFMEEMANRGYPADIVTYNCFLKVLCDNKRCKEALRFFRAMVEKGCEPSIQSYNMLIVMFFEAGDPDNAIGAWDVMHRRGCLPAVETYCNMISGFFRCDRSKEACSLVEEVVGKRMKLPYDSLDSILAQLSKTGNLQAIHALSKHMRRFYNRAREARFNLNERGMRVRRGDAG